jgi:cobalt-zinc-cadmium efflux system protein
MAHNHDHHDHQHHGHGSQGNIKIAFFLNLLFTLLEIVGGLWTNSMAILSDALHDLGDSVSLGISWLLEKYSLRGPDQKYSFGYARFSLLGALLNSIILLGGSLIILVRAVPRIISPEPLNTQGMIIFAILGIVINGAAVLRLRKGTSLNERVVLWHLLEDVLGWVVILAASIVLTFIDIPILDPILSVLITLYILYHVLVNLREVLSVFLQKVPGDYCIHEIEQELATVPAVQSVHHTHIWSLEGQKHFLSTHVVLGNGTNQEEIVCVKKEIRDLVKARGIEHVTMEIEFANEDCQGHCCY